MTLPALPPAALPPAALPLRLPSPGPALALWRLDLSGRGMALADALTCLSGPEQARCAALRRPADRLRFAVTRASLRLLLAGRLGLPPQALPLGAGAHGKPCLGLPGAPAFNVSHAGAHGLVALAQAPQVTAVGVDVERIDAALDPPALREMARVCFTPRERAWLAARAAAQWPAAFHALWTAKEALLKAPGVGIAAHLQQVSVLPAGAGARFAVMPETREAAALLCDGRVPRLYALPAPPGYAAAVAWLAPAQPGGEAGEAAEAGEAGEAPGG
ncbi:4'-phosphopantetheinyl transferase family protein [Cupriavidus sp. 30B13]|uniref:4'-phosphopantetheinyl transferase family protein n=1 Tax=Cupriavidus sp. 30B13 TaxID=3384241 RepID=UPI003B919230